MCSRVKCSKCNKVTWSGCGAHVDSVMRGVPQSDRCTCAEKKKTAASPEKMTDGGTLWGRLFGR